MSAWAISVSRKSGTRMETLGSLPSRVSGGTVLDGSGAVPLWAMKGSELQPRRDNQREYRPKGEPGEDGGRKGQRQTTAPAGRPPSRRAGAGRAKPASAAFGFPAPGPGGFDQRLTVIARDRRACIARRGAMTGGAPAPPASRLPAGGPVNHEGRAVASRARPSGPAKGNSPSRIRHADQPAVGRAGWRGDRPASRRMAVRAGPAHRAPRLR